MGKSKKPLTKKQIEIIEFYLKVLKKNASEKITQAKLKQEGLVLSKMKYHFGGIRKLENKAFEYAPEYFPENYNPELNDREKNILNKKNKIKETYKKILIKKEKKGAVTISDMKQAGITRSQIRHTYDKLTNLEKEVFKEYKELFPENYKVGDSRLNFSKKEGLKYYIELKKELGRIPLTKEINQHIIDGPSSSWFNRYFGGIKDIEEAARKYYPDEFKDYSIKQLNTPSRIKELRSDIKKYKRFIITTAVTGCEVDENFYKSLKKLAKQKNAKILVLVCSDPARSKDTANKLGHIDKMLAENETVIIEDTALNENLHISTIKLTAKQINPITGLDRIGKKDGSFIYASPKFMLKYTAVRNSKEKLPHCLMTTGAITKANYRSEMYMSQRTAYIAEFDHRLGAVYVEIEDKKKYHFRQVQCLNEDGEIHLDGIKYSPKTKKSERPEAFVMGDIHVGATCQKTRQAWIEIIRKYKPKKLVLHDALNGHSINHWIEKDIIAKTLQVQKGLDCLDKELKMFSEELRFWSKLVDEILIVPSNHNDWLERWLRQAKYAKDAKNHYVGVSISKYWMDRLRSGIKCSPVQPAVEDYCGLNLKNITWLDRNEDYYIGDVQINCHGDVATNGSRGSLVGMERAYGSSASGHSHTAGIIRDAWAVGTSTHLQEDYNNGPSTWTNTSMLIYKDGSRCLYNAIGGSWNDRRN